MLKLLDRETSVECRRKALYALTTELRHNKQGMEIFTQHRGWNVFAEELNSKDEAIQKRLIYFLGNILLEQDESSSLLSTMAKLGIPQKLIDLLIQQPLDAEDHIEKILVTLSIIAERTPPANHNLIIPEPSLSLLANHLPKLKDRYGELIESDIWDSLDKTTHSL